MSLVNELFDTNVKAKATRLSFGEELKELGKTNKDIVALDADLSKSTQTMHFAEAFPDRFFNMGIAEANMIGAAAGLARAGKIPFAASFGAFLTGRFDQIRMSVSFSNVPVRLIGTHAGVGIGEDGHSQMALEDLALMRSLPNMVVFHPADDWETREFMKWSLKDKRPCYMRLTRQGLPPLQEAKRSEFKEGHWNFLKTADKDNGIVIVGTGSMLKAAAEAADIFSEKTSAPVTFVNASWIKPHAAENIKKIIDQKAKLVVSIEDHYTVGGLGGLLAEELCNYAGSPKLLRLGVEEFGQSGSPADNLEYYRLTGPKLAEDILKHWTL